MNRSPTQRIKISRLTSFLNLFRFETYGICRVLQLEKMPTHEVSHKPTKTYLRRLAVSNMTRHPFFTLFLQAKKSVHFSYCDGLKLRDKERSGTKSQKNSPQKPSTCPHNVLYKIRGHIRTQPVGVQEHSRPIAAIPSLKHAACK